MIKTLLATMFVYLAGHDIKNVLFIKSHYVSTEQSHGSNQSVGLLVLTKELQMPFGIRPFVAVLHLPYRVTVVTVCTAGTELTHLRWKPPKFHFTQPVWKYRECLLIGAFI